MWYVVPYESETQRQVVSDRLDVRTPGVVLARSVGLRLRQGSMMLSPFFTI